MLLHTNHFVADRFDRLDVSVWAMPSSPVRLQRLLAGVGAMPDPVSRRAFGALLSDHANYPAAICCHPDLTPEPLDQARTVTSVLMDLNARRMRIADGNPCTTPFRELDYSGFLAG